MIVPLSPSRLLDTDIIIDIQRKHPPAQAWIATFAPGRVGIPGFVAMELIQAAQSAAQARAADKIIAPLPVIWPTEAHCRLGLAEFRRLHLSHGLGLIDALIAATTLAWARPSARSTSSIIGP